MNTATKQIENNKNFDAELGFIEKLNTLNGYEIKIVGHENVKASISKTEGTFNLKIDARLIEESEDDLRLNFILNNETYEIKKLSNTYTRSAFNKDKSVNYRQGWV